MKLFLSLFILSLISCQNVKNEHLIDSEKSLEELKTSVVASEYPFLIPTDLLRFQNHLYIIDEGQTSYLHKLDANLNQVTKSFLVKGEGPNELMNSPIIFNSEHNGELFILELATNEVYKLNENNSEIEYSFDLPESLGLINQVRYIGENQLVGKSGLSNGNLFFYDLSSNSLQTTAFTPSLEQPIEESDEKFVYNSFIASNQKEGITIEVMQYFDWVNFYDANGEVIKSIGDKEPQKFYDNDNGSFSGPDTNLHYVDVAGDENFCYALYLGETANKANNKPNSIEMTIRLFSWDGQYIKSFKLKSLCTSIEAMDGKLYGIDPSNEENAIFEIELGDL